VSQSSLRFLLSRRWIGFAIFVVVLAGLCVRLGFWQYDRLQQRLDRNDVTARHLATDPVPLATVLRPGEQVDGSKEWTRVRASGVYDVEHQVTVKFTTRDGAPGVDVVTPLMLADGTAILVDRGWLPTQNTAARPTNVPAPPAGAVTVTGWLRSDSGADEEAVRPVGGQVRAISSVGLSSTVPAQLYGGYLNLRSQQPPAETSLQLEPRPDLGQGPHFFYALQWWFFGLLALIGYVWFARDEMTERRAARQERAA
jgi:cytochrome oxidase assembly protein ShyY1